MNRYYHVFYYILSSLSTMFQCAPVLNWSHYCYNWIVLMNAGSKSITHWMHVLPLLHSLSVTLLRAEAILCLAVVNSSRRSITHHLNMPPYFVLSQCASLSWYSIFALQRWILVGRVLSMCPHSVMMQWHAYCSCFCRVVCTRLLKYHFCWDSPVNCINLASTQWADWDII